MEENQIKCIKRNCINEVTQRFKKIEVIPIDGGVKTLPYHLYSCGEHLEEATKNFPNFYLDETFSTQS